MRCALPKVTIDRHCWDMSQPTKCGEGGWRFREFVRQPGWQFCGNMKRKRANRTGAANLPESADNEILKVFAMLGLRFLAFFI